VSPDGGNYNPKVGFKVLNVLVSATVSAAAPSSLGSVLGAAIWPIIIVAIILFSLANGRATQKRRQQQQQQPHPGAPVQTRTYQGQPQQRPAQPGRPAPNQQAQYRPGQGSVGQPTLHRATLLNGIPIPPSATDQAQYSNSYSMQRMLMEQQLKQRLDALDSARRNGQVTAEQYSIQRDAIFKSF
jgi:hypothetical protein